MAKVGDLKVTIVQQTDYCIVFAPVARYKRVGDESLLTVFGIPVYKRVGDLSIVTLCGMPVYKRAGGARQILGVRFGENVASPE